MEALISSTSYWFMYPFFLLCLTTVVQQFYQSRVIDEFVLRGNTGILKCLVPSFVADFVQVETWIADDGKVYTFDPNSTGKISD